MHQLIHLHGGTHKTAENEYDCLEKYKFEIT